MTLRVVELFAGVGGFRLGLEGPPGSTRNGPYKVVFSNQWEPSTKIQHAADIYVNKWQLIPSEERDNFYIGKADGSDLFVNEDISKINVKDIPNHDLLVGGFPCQDYSVAKTLDKAKGLQGKKGVLWWEIYRILKAKKSRYVLLENVDRLIKSPVNQRGRDFAIMLSCLSELDYAVEWRVINAAEYGMPQRRRRIFILAYRKGTNQYKKFSKNNLDVDKLLTKNGLIATAFPVISGSNKEIKEHNLLNLGEDITDLSINFNINGLPGNKSPFENSGFMIKNSYWTLKTKPDYEGRMINLGDILMNPSKIPDEYFISIKSLNQTKGWQYLKGAKKELRQGRDGFTYNYNEGGMIFPDSLDRASRTIITGEGGTSPSRFKHVVKFKPTKNQIIRLELESNNHNKIREKLNLSQKEWIRRLTPIELERLNQFPDGHTAGVSDAKRAFFMGNALVIGIIKRFAHILSGKE